MIYDGQTIEHRDRSFLIHLVDDNDCSEPWLREDGHGPVRIATSKEQKRPGEKLLVNRDVSHPLIRFYDVQAATKLARAEWGLSDDEKAGLFSKLERPPTDGEIAARAVELDFQHLDGWLNEKWCYVGVCVQLLDNDGEPETEEYEHALWGIESTAYDYIEEVALDLADGILDTICRESSEVAYWAARGVQTYPVAMPYGVGA